jgi:hypothetical protein
MNRSGRILVPGKGGNRTQRKSRREQHAHDSSWQFRDEVHHSNIA